MKSSTSAKFLSAWTPPAVAQAPIVTSFFDESAHLLDPLRVVRGRDRALDEREVVRALALVARLASRKYAISTSPASASSSSSQSSSESWQPSQEANFQTASFGFRAPAHSSRTAISCSHLVVAVDRPVAADQRRAELAVAAVAEPAAHVALHRDVDPLGRDAALEQGAGREVHHDLRPADERDGGRRGRSARRRSASARRRPCPASLSSAASTVTSTWRSNRPRRRSSSLAEEQVGRASGCRRGAPPRRTRRGGARTLVDGRAEAARARSRPRRRRRRCRAAASTGHALPNGPRTPSTAPGCDAQIACVTAPTARTVWIERAVGCRPRPRSAPRRSRRRRAS